MSRAARISAALVAIAALASLVLRVAATLQDIDGGLLSALWRNARFFTNLTAALVAGGFTAMALRGRFLQPAWTAGLALWIGLVGVVYYALLYRPLEGLALYADWGLHAVTPALAVGFWVALAPKSTLAPRHAAAWMLWPALYAGYALGRGAVDGTYPYFFLDPTRVGWTGVALWSAALAAAVGIAGLAMVWASRRLAVRAA